MGKATKAANETVKIRQNRHAKLFAGSISECAVMFTGNGPIKTNNLVDLVRSLSAKAYTEIGHPADLHFVVIGWNDFDKPFLDLAVRHKNKLLEHSGKHTNQNSLKFFSQEDFLNYLLFNEQPEYYPGDPRINNHAGLKYLVTIPTFKWPVLNESLAATESDTTSKTEKWKEESFLRQYGYRVDRSTNLAQRRNALSEAVPKEGLQPVAEHIAFLWKFNQHNGSKKAALDNWRKDLKWLKDKYFKNQFTWPFD